VRPRTIDISVNLFIALYALVNEMAAKLNVGLTALTVRTAAEDDRLYPLWR
jgi:hypothetical protein